MAIQKALVVGLLLTAPPLRALAGSPGPEGRACAAAGVGPYPTFCAIPTAPTDVRPAKAFKSAVVETRLAGRQLVRDTAPETFGLPAGQAEAFSQAGQAAIAPVGSSSAPADTGAFADDARREVIPPPLPRRRISPQPR